MNKSQVEKSPSSPQKKRNIEVRTPLKNEDCTIQYGGTSAKNEDDVSLIGSDSKDKRTLTKVYEFLLSLTIEPAVFGFMFAFVMNISILPNMIMDKGCLFYYNYSKEVCDNISHYGTEKKNVETLATTYSLYANLTSFIAAFLMTFIAPWSDKYGRRIPLLVSVVGALLTDIGILLCAAYFESSPLYIVISRLPSEFTGGFICMLTIVFSHASEVSSEKNRTLKYTTVEIALGLGVAFGGITGGFFYRYYGYFDVYLIVVAVHLFCFFWTLCIVKETTGLDVNMKWHEKMKDFFTCESFKASFITTCRARQGKTKILLLLLLASMCTIILNYEGFGSIAYVYTHHIYNWDPTIYNVVNTSSWLSGLLVTMIIVPILVKVFKFRDFTLGIIGSFSMIGKNFLISFSKYHTYVYYTAVAIGAFTPLTTLAVRSGMSKLVEKEELGRVFSFLATCEAIVPVLGTIAITELFNSTIDTFPNVTYLSAVSLLMLPLVTFVWALKNTKTPYSELSVPVNDDTKEKV